MWFVLHHDVCGSSHYHGMHTTFETSALQIVALDSQNYLLQKNGQQLSHRH